MTEFVSLYDHLGKAAGKELGKQVADLAKACGVPHKAKHITNPLYDGLVMLYPKAFLELCFKAYSNNGVDFTELNTQLMEDSFEQSEKRIY